MSRFALLLGLFHAFCAGPSAFADESVIARAIAYFEAIPEIRMRIENQVSPNWPMRTTILSTVASTDEKKWKVVLSLAMRSPMRPLLGAWTLESTRIIELRAPEWVPVDLTDVGLPEGDFKACFYIAYRGKRELAGRECFALTRLHEKRWIRLRGLGFLREMIPWRHLDGSESYSEVAIEECDGAFDDRDHATGWCPWGAKFESVIDGSGHEAAHRF